MVRFATTQLRAGHLPLTGWFPYLGLGSPQFLHYQSLPAMLAGMIGLVIGPNAAFRWTLYLLLSLWPVSVYACARMFGVGRWSAAVAAAMAPFLMSTTAIAYEQNAYVWRGYGVWTQLWASMTLPLAWGCSWRAVRDGRGYLPAVALVSLTAMLHFETGYLAFAPLLLWPIAAGRPFIVRVRRMAIVLGCSLLATAWVVVPLIEQRAWAAINEPLQHGGLVNGYGALRVTGWLLTGGLLDHGRFPVITIVFVAGVVVAAFRAVRSPDARALLASLVACMLLSFGRATFGSLVVIIPGSSDIFFRRFMMGIQLAALVLAGIGAVWVVKQAWILAARLIPRVLDRAGRSGPVVALEPATRELLIGCAALLAVVGALAPAWLQLDSYDNGNNLQIQAQRAADALQGAELDRLLAIVARDGGGRVYAGNPSDWGPYFTVGAVPVFKYLESRDVDEVGYTLRTASLMTDPEFYFDWRNPSDYVLFGIRYVLRPRGAGLPTPGTRISCSGPYCLWRLDFGGYVHTGEIVGTIAANRSDVGIRSVALLRSALPQQHHYLLVDWNGAPAPRRPVKAARTQLSSSVSNEHDDLPGGEVAAYVTMSRPGVVVLSASFDPGWQILVDGRRQAAEMLAPALVGAAVPAGRHRVTFVYHGYGGYAYLLALCLIGLLLAAIVDLKPHALITARRG